MKKSILAASLSAALCLLTSHSVMAQNISIDSSRTDTATGKQVATTAYTASGEATFTGANSDIDYALTGDWSGLFSANGSANSWDIKNFNNLKANALVYRAGKIVAIRGREPYYLRLEFPLTLLSGPYRE